MPKCPECSSTNLRKYGLKFRSNLKINLQNRTKVQQYQCKDCGRITTKPLEDDNA